jgi:dolichol-phosphate mannosyltransferase
VIEQLRQERSVEVVFVDDGSTDAPYQKLLAISAGQANMTIAQHPVNRGLGAALHTGFAQAVGDVVVTTDSDGTYGFDEIPALLSYLKPGVDIVTASPYHQLGGVENVPGYRIFLSRGSSLIYQIIVDRHIATYTALFRAYRREVTCRVPFYSAGFLAGTELMVNAMLMGYKVAEYPTTLHSRAAGASKAKVLRIIRAHLRYQWSVVLRRLRLAPLPQPLEQEKAA